MGVFVNHTNHPAERWSEVQRVAAEKYGDIVDMPFPRIPPDWGEGEIAELAAMLAADIGELAPAAVLCQGEYSYTYRLVRELARQGIVCLSACSDRVVEEVTEADGSVRRVSYFDFVRFRRYE